MLKGCCCFRLNTAGLIIGWMHTIISLAAIISSLVSLANLDQKVTIIEENQKYVNLNEEKEMLRNVLLVTHSMYLGAYSVNLILSVLLIVGTIKERHFLLLPWLVINGVALLICCILLLPFTLALSPYLLCLLPLYAFYFYIWYVVYSLYKQIQENRDLQHILVPAETPSSNPPYENFK